MRVVVTGREGQVARSLQSVGSEIGIEVIRVGRPGVDLSEPSTVAPALLAARPDVIVNAAAYTAVDKAESEPDLARAINAHGAGAVADAAARAGVPIIHISTDYVFDGRSGRPYREDDLANPLGVYGSTKLEGERAVASRNPLHVILRTAWVYSPYGQNFVKTMLRLAETREEIGVVADQWGSPTSAIDIANTLLQIAGRVVGVRDEASPLFGTFHMAARGEAVWADVAEAVFARSGELGGPTARVKRIATAAYPTPAKRPANSRLDGSKLAAIYGVALPHWRESLNGCVAALLTSSFEVSTT